VNGDWTVTDANNTSSTGTTGPEGRVTLSSGNIRNATGFVFCVSSLSKIGYADKSDGECDGDGDSGGGDPPVEMGALDGGSSRKGKNHRANLYWVGGGGTVVVLRGTESGNLSTLATISNSQSYTDNVGKNPPNTGYYYQVCNTGAAADCSNEKLIEF